MPAGEIAAAVEAATNLAKMGIGIGQNIKANTLAKRLVRPTYNIQQPVIDSYRLAERNASQGMSDAARTSYNNEADRGLTTGIDAMLRGAGNINSFSHFYDTYANDHENLTKFEDEMRMRNTGTYFNQADNMANALDKKWQVDEWAPYKDQSQYIAGLRGQSFKNITGGIDGIGAGAMHYLQSGLYKDPPTTGETGLVPSFTAKPTQSDYDILPKVSDSGY